MATWATPQYSKDQVKKAGAAFIDPATSPDDQVIARAVTNNWRSSHGFPLNTMQMTLRRKVKRRTGVLPRPDNIPVPDVTPIPAAVTRSSSPAEVSGRPKVPATVHARRSAGEILFTRYNGNPRFVGARALRSIKICIPNLESQQAAVRQVKQGLDEVQRLTVGVKRAVAGSRGLRQSLLAAAFSGRLTGRSTHVDLAEGLASV
jgi:hypothetical protein